MLDFETINKFYNNSKSKIDLGDKTNNIKEKGIYEACFNMDVINKTENTFNIQLPETKIYNQGESNSCWIYAYLSFIKPSICKELNIANENFDLSVNYIHFFDRLEKANILYEEIINNNLNFQNGIDENLLDRYIHTCGSFDNAKDIIKKYGIIPNNLMPMNVNNFEPFIFNKVFKEKVKNDIVKIVELSNMDEKEKFKDKCLEENYILLSKVFGQPPISFDFNYQDLNKNEIKFNNITPKNFLDICYKEDMNEYIFVKNNPNKNYYEKYSYNEFNNIYNIDHIFYNLPVSEIKKSIIKQLEEGIPVWFGCDFKAVCGSYSNKVGILDSNLLDYKNILGFEILPKLENQKFNSCNYHHAMIIVGAQIENGKPIRWKVQNSFGKENNLSGYFVMNDNYFDDYAVMFGINRKFIEKL